MGFEAKHKYIKGISISLLILAFIPTIYHNNLPFSLVLWVQSLNNGIIVNKVFSAPITKAQECPN